MQPARLLLVAGRLENPARNRVPDLGHTFDAFECHDCAHSFSFVVEEVEIAVRESAVIVLQPGQGRFDPHIVLIEAVNEARDAAISGQVGASGTRGLRAPDFWRPLPYPLIFPALPL